MFCFTVQIKRNPRTMTIIRKIQYCQYHLVLLKKNHGVAKVLLSCQLSFFSSLSWRKMEKVFLKWLKCHESKTAYNRKGEIELLTITSNSVYDARRHIEVPYYFISVFNLIIFPCGLVVFTFIWVFICFCLCSFKLKHPGCLAKFNTLWGEKEKDPSNAGKWKSNLKQP